MSDNLPDREPERTDPAKRAEGDFLNAIAMDFDPELKDGWMVWRVDSEVFRDGRPTGEKISHEYTLHSSQCLDIASNLMRAASLAKGDLHDATEFDLMG